MRWLGVMLTAMLCLGSAGCFGTKKLVSRTLPPLPQVAARPLPEPTIEPTLQLSLPLETIDIAEVTLDPSPQMETPAPKPAPRRRAGIAPAAPTPPPAEAEPTTQPAPAPPVPAPQLQEIMTDDERRHDETDFASSVTRAKEAISRIAGRNLSPVQQVSVQRIQTFLQQAEEARVKDLVTALKLAQRADLLGQDLLKSLQ